MDTSVESLASSQGSVKKWINRKRKNRVVDKEEDNEKEEEKERSFRSVVEEKLAENKEPLVIQQVFSLSYPR
jgi:hypothetical protein